MKSVLKVKIITTDREAASREHLSLEIPTRPTEIGLFNHRRYQET